ncbi:DUF2357 domain-containing protein [Bacillus salacetis]|nr:DUF2357 domain-containing protein [Bacillus salacetis]
MTPFQSGIVHIFLNGKEWETYVYPDSRKLTEQQFECMISDILEESNSCFQLSSLEKKVNASGRNRGPSWTLWIYIERSFQQLRQLFSLIEKQPFRKLIKLPITQKREKVQRVERTTLNWLDQKGFGKDVPSNVETDKTFESLDLYENQVLKKQIFDLKNIFKTFTKVERDDVSEKAKKYYAITLRWLNTPFMREVSMHQGSYSITQKFRKHPVYRQWYQWFDELFKHDRERIGLEYPIALKDTFELYEMWCFMMIIKMLRELELLNDSEGLFKTTSNGLFLDLAQSKESRIKLHGGKSLYFQRNYQYNSKKFHTYTQRMIPDIVLEEDKEILVFDPKYRVPGNLGTALGEMHKYRDGILHRETGGRAVKEVYILTPTQEETAETMRFFQDEYQERYKMGAIQMLPGVDDLSSVRSLLMRVFGILH